MLFLFSYVTTLPENAVEGTPLVFEGEMDQVQDLDKVKKKLNYFPFQQIFTFFGKSYIEIRI